MISAFSFCPEGFCAFVHYFCRFQAVLRPAKSPLSPTTPSKPHITTLRAPGTVITKKYHVWTSLAPWHGAFKQLEIATLSSSSFLLHTICYQKQIPGGSSVIKQTDCSPLHNGLEVYLRRSSQFLLSTKCPWASFLFIVTFS